MNVFSVQQLAKICRAAPRTVSKWIDSGRMVGAKDPQSGDRQVLRADLVKFLTEHGFSSDRLEELEKAEAETH